MIFRVCDKVLYLGAASKKWYFWVEGAVWGEGGSRPDHNFRPKKYHFLFLLPFDAEAFKTCKNTIKLINLCALPCLGLGLWLTLTVYFVVAKLRLGRGEEV